MTENAPVAGFSQVLEEFNKIVASREIVQRDEYTSRIEARRKWKELSALRQRIFNGLLAERGLVVCSKASSHLRPELYLKIHSVERGKHTINQEEIAKLTQQDFGVFPKNQMRFHFSRHTNFAYNGNPYLEGQYQFDELELLCSEHFPDRTNTAHRSNAHEHNRQGELDIESEVLEKDGKLITKIGNVDVTQISVARVMDSAIYQYFGLPQLPPKPEI